MPRKLTVLSSLFTVIFALLLTVNRQPLTVLSATPYEQAQNDYSFQLSKYAQSRDRYLTAKANYQAFKTATAKNEAFAKTKEYFIQVHVVYLAYLFLVEERTNIFDWSFSSYKKDEYIRKLDTESNFIIASQKRAEAVTTLEEITPIAEQLELHLDEVTKPQVNIVLATADLAQIEDVFFNFKQSSGNIDNYVSGKIPQENAALYLNWKSEIEGIKQKVEGQISISRAYIAQNQNPENYSAADSIIYTQTQEARDELERSKSLLAEILNYI